jgi:hypothetical protein
MPIYTDSSNIKEHPVYQLGDKVNEICAPLFNNFPINYFDYSRIYAYSGPNRSTILLQIDQ